MTSKTVQPTRLAMHGVEEAKAILQDHVASSNGSSTLSPGVYLDFIQHFGALRDAHCYRIDLTRQERQFLREAGRLQQTITEAHKEADYNLLWGSDTLPLQPLQLDSAGSMAEFGCLQYAWVAKLLLSLYRAKHREGTEDDRQRFDSTPQAMEGTHYTVEGLMAINTRDVMLFNVHQQHRIRDARGTGFQTEALAARLLLERRGSWRYLKLLLKHQSRDSEGVKRFQRPGYEVIHPDSTA